MIQSVQCVRAVKSISCLLHCDFYFIYRLYLLNDICALNHALKNISEENLLKVPLYGAEEFSFKINSEILKCTIKFSKKKQKQNKTKQIALVAHYFFLIFSPLTKYLVFYNFICILCSIYVQNLHQAVYVLCKFCILCCVVLLLLFSIAL